MKKCPYCNEDIQDLANKCRYCGEWINQSDLPNTNVESIKKQEGVITKQKNISGSQPQEFKEVLTWTLKVGAFLFGLGVVVFVIGINCGPIKECSDATVATITNLVKIFLFVVIYSLFQYLWGILKFKWNNKG